MSTNALPFFLAVTFATATAVAIPAQDQEGEQRLQSGPKAGTQATPVKVYAASGPFQGKEFDAIKTIGDRPGVLLFIKDVSRETAAIIRAIGTVSNRYGPLVQSFSVLLNGDRTIGEKDIKRFSFSLNLRNPITLSLDGAEGPGNYALNRDCTLTLVTMDKGVIKESIAFTDTGHGDVPIVEKAFAAIAGAPPKDAAELAERLPGDDAKLKKMVAEVWAQLNHVEQMEKQRRQMQNERRRKNRGGRNNRNRRNGGNRRMEEGRQRQARRRGGRDDEETKRRGARPKDAELLELAKAMRQASNTSEDLDGLFKKINARVGQDNDRQKQMVDAMMMLHSMGWGNDEARKRAWDYAMKHGAKRKKPTSRRQDI